MRKRFIAPALLSVALFGGCSGFDDERGRGDAPIGPYDDSPAEVVNFPDKFANVAHKCDGHGHRIYSTTRQAAVTVIEDATCPGAPAR